MRLAQLLTAKKKKRKHTVKRKKTEKALSLNTQRQKEYEWACRAGEDPYDSVGIGQRRRAGQIRTGPTQRLAAV